MSGATWCNQDNKTWNLRMDFMDNLNPIYGGVWTYYPYIQVIDSMDKSKSSIALRRSGAIVPVRGSNPLRYTLLIPPVGVFIFKKARFRVL